MLQVEPREPTDPDLLLRITYKNWAALDGALAKGDEIAKADRRLRGRGQPGAVRSLQDPDRTRLGDHAGARAQVALRVARHGTEGAGPRARLLFWAAAPCPGFQDFAVARPGCQTLCKTSTPGWKIPGQVVCFGRRLSKVHHWSSAMTQSMNVAFLSVFAALLLSIAACSSKQESPGTRRKSDRGRATQCRGGSRHRAAARSAHARHRAQRCHRRAGSGGGEFRCDFAGLRAAGSAVAPASPLLQSHRTAVLDRSRSQVQPGRGRPVARRRGGRRHQGRHLPGHPGPAGWRRHHLAQRQRQGVHVRHFHGWHRCGSA